MVVAETRIPSPASSFWIRRYPHPRILLRQTNDKDSHFDGDRRTPWALLGIGTSTGDEPAMPGKQSLRSDEEHRASPAPEQPRRCCEKDSVGVHVLRTCNLTTQDRELVSEDDELEVIRALGSEAEHDEVENTSDKKVEKRSEHDEALPSLTSEPRLDPNSEVPAQVVNWVLAPHRF